MSDVTIHVTAQQPACLEHRERRICAGRSAPRDRFLRHSVPKRRRAGGKRGGTTIVRPWRSFQQEQALITGTSGAQRKRHVLSLPVESTRCLREYARLALPLTNFRVFQEHRVNCVCRTTPVRQLQCVRGYGGRLRRMTFWRMTASDARLRSAAAAASRRARVPPSPRRRTLRQRQRTDQNDQQLQHESVVAAAAARFNKDYFWRG